MSLPNVSADLVWEITRNNNSYLVKRNTGGGVQFSRDPLNLANKNSRKHAGYVNEKAVGISAEGDKGVHVVSKTKAANQPAKNAHKRTFGSHNRKTFKNIASSTAKSGYRPDLREAAIARASAIRRSQRPVKPEPERKLRGNAAKKAAQE
ncbi:putative ribosomal protein l28e [Diaporthe ampelina]|uniref:Putative ribosomal protein l28e n=1 Tax=Diaporthe ampelina TaxID=1214573 RepID=A0A0G2I197_9PEZI|nr:putative ribosomal protein l28e [Diaporthe ampelina]